LINKVGINDRVIISEKEGMTLTPSDQYYYQQPKQPGFVFGYARMTDEEIRPLMKRLGRAFEKAGIT